MNKVTITGIAQSDANDDRTLILLSVNYNNNVFPWFIRMPRDFVGSFQDFIDSKESSIYSDVAAKLQTWSDLNPKTREVVDYDTGETLTIPIEMLEIVKPTYPDYYVLRAREYPAMSEQLDAFWKGGAAADAMKEKIAAIKTKYPKT